MISVSTTSTSVLNLSNEGFGINLCGSEYISKFFTKEAPKADADGASVDIKVPVLPESVADATIAAWHVKAGEAVSRDQNLVDIETLVEFNYYWLSFF